MKKISFIFALILICTGLTGFFNPVSAKESYTAEFNNFYGTDGTNGGSTLGSCITCHNTANGNGYNPYGMDVLLNSRNYGAIEPLDSDGDGFDNITEIIDDTLPGDPNSKPVPGSTNDPPVADAGPDQTVDEGITVTLNGSNSSDPDDGIATYSWVQLDGVKVNLSNPAAAKPIFLSPDVDPNGVALTFQLTVTDKSGQESMDKCIVNVSWINEAPTADAGPDQNVNEGTKVKLNGINSSDPDDGIKSYEWKQLDGIAVSLTDATKVEASFTAPSVGSNGAKLTFELTVTDLGGLKSTNTCIVNVGSVNAAPTADAGPDQKVFSGDSVTLDGSNSSDPENGITGYSWSQINGPSVTLSDPKTSSPTFQAPVAGVDGTSLTFELTVTDNGGLQATDTCIVNIAGANRPPVADAGSDQTVKAGTLVTLDGSGSVDPEDGIADYLWTQTDGPSVMLSDPKVMNPTFLAPEASPDGAKLSFLLTVTDIGGLKSTSTCIVNIAAFDPPASNQPPKADAGPDFTVSEGVLVTLDGSNSSDPDDGIAGYLWKQIDGPQVKLNNPPPEKPTFIAPEILESSATLTFQLTVTDKAGQSASDICIVTVLAVDGPPGNEPPGNEQSSFDGVLAEIKALLEDPETPDKVRRRLENAENLLERSAKYLQNNRSEKALKIVKRSAKKLRAAFKKAKGNGELQNKLTAIIDDLKNMASTRIEAPEKETDDIPDKVVSGDEEDEMRNTDKDDDEAEEADDEGEEMTSGLKKAKKYIGIRGSLQE